jgi:hypothetical protein
VKNNRHIVFRLSARLLITAVVLCVLFGNGTHLHTVFDHLSDHGDIHAILHAHPTEAGHSNTDEDDNDAHDHPTVTVELEGTLAQKTVHEALTDITIAAGAGIIPGVHGTDHGNPLFLDLPPPDLLVLYGNSSPLSLRGPPTG